MLPAQGADVPDLGNVIPVTPAGKAPASQAFPLTSRGRAALAVVVRGLRKMGDEIRIPDKRGWAIPVVVLLSLVYGIRSFGRTEAKVDEAIRSIARVEAQYSVVLARMAMFEAAKATEAGQLDAIQAQTATAASSASDAKAAAESAREELRERLAIMAREDRLFRDMTWGRIQHFKYATPPGDPLELMKAGKIGVPEGG